MNHMGYYYDSLLPSGGYDSDTIYYFNVAANYTQ